MFLHNAEQAVPLEIRSAMEVLALPAHYHVPGSLVNTALATVPFALDCRGGAIRTLRDLVHCEGEWRVRTGRAMLCFARPELLWHVGFGPPPRVVLGDWQLYGVTVFESVPIYEENIASIAKAVDGDSQ